MLKFALFALLSCGLGVFAATCTRGQYRAADLSCLNCNEGTFSTSINAASCTAFRTCAAGYYIKNVGTPTSNRVCMACINGYYSDIQNAALCTLFTTCPAGQRELKRPTATSDRVCEVLTTTTVITTSTPRSTRSTRTTASRAPTTASLFYPPAGLCPAHTQVSVARTVIASNHGVPTYQPSQDCLWTITAPLGRVPRLTFTSFRTEEEYDYVKLSYDSAFNVIRASYTGTAVPPAFTSTQRILYVSFSSDDQYADLGFAAIVTFV